MTFLKPSEQKRTRLAAQRARLPRRRSSTLPALLILGAIFWAVLRFLRAHR